MVGVLPATGCTGLGSPSQKRWRATRTSWGAARRELLAALKILDNGDIDREHMVAPWAGAMGQTQFLPSNFLAYAVDADGDGRRDMEWPYLHKSNVSAINVRDCVR
jgi:Transglycosylase SLT domain